MEGGPFGLDRFCTLVKKVKNERDDLLVSTGFVRYVKKVKNERDDLLVSTGFVRYVKKVKNGRGTFWSRPVLYVT